MVYYHNELDEYEHHYRVRPSSSQSATSPPNQEKQIQLREHSRTRSKAPSVAASVATKGEPELPRLGLAASSVLGSALSNLATYPLTLIAARLQVQEHLKKQHARFPGRSRSATLKHPTSNPTSRRHSDVDPITRIPGPAAADTSREMPEMESERPEIEWDEMDFAEHYDSVFDAVDKIYKAEGFTGFWAGVGWDTVGTVTTGLAYWGAYTFLREQRKEILRLHSQGRRMKRVRIPILEELALGIGASAMARFITAPLSTIVTRKQTAVMLHGPYTRTPRIAEIAQNIMREKGITGFWAGYEASLLLTANPSITFLLYESSKQWITSNTGRRMHGGEVFFLAAVCKALATAITYPLMVARSRAQMDLGPKMEEGHWKRKHSGGVMEMLNRIVEKEGYAGLYEGVGVEILKGVLSHGTAVAIKEAVHRTILKLYFFVLQAYTRTEHGTVRETVQMVAKDRAARHEQRKLAGKAHSERTSESSRGEFGRRNRRDVEESHSTRHRSDRAREDIEELHSSTRHRPERAREEIEELHSSTRHRPERAREEIEELHSSTRHRPERAREEIEELHSSTRHRPERAREDIEVRETTTTTTHRDREPIRAASVPPPPPPAAPAPTPKRLKIEDWREDVHRETVKVPRSTPASVISSTSTPIEKTTVATFTAQQHQPSFRERDRFSSAGFSGRSGVVSERDSVRVHPSASERSVWSEKPRFVDRGGVRAPPNTPRGGAATAARRWEVEEQEEVWGKGWK